MKRQEQERQTMAGNLKKNDEVLTNSGIYGTVIDVSDSDDKITVKIADNVRIKMTKAASPQSDERGGGQASQGRQRSQGVNPASGAQRQQGHDPLALRARLARVMTKGMKSDHEIVSQ